MTLTLERKRQVVLMIPIISSGKRREYVPVGSTAASMPPTFSPETTEISLNKCHCGCARFSPHFHWDGEEGIYIGGQFWNGRGATLAEQAMGPPLNPLEMAMPGRSAVVSRLKENPVYVPQFFSLFGIDLDAIPANPEAPADLTAPPGVQAACERMAHAIAAFEKSRLFNQFNATTRATESRAAVRI
jgi:cytochrome c peroxidase